MIHDFVAKLIIGGAIAIVGFASMLLGDSYFRSERMYVAGLVFFCMGLLYGIVATIAALWQLLNHSINEGEKRKTIKERNRAQDELLKYKELLDQGILSPDEFSKKSDELKRQIL